MEELNEMAVKATRLEPDAKSCQCQCENLRAASLPMPALMFQRRLKRAGGFLYEALRYLRNRGPLRMAQKLVSLATNNTRMSAAEKQKAENRRRLGHREAGSADCEALDLQAGELVEVKSEDEIRETFDGKHSSRGLLFLPEMREYCGKRFRVSKRLERMMIESTGEVRRVKNTVLLEGVVCDGSRHSGCDRSCFFYWREAWLRRVQQQ